MSRFCTVVAALLLSSIALFAAETAAPTPPPAGPTFTPYGSVAYRLRGDIVRNSLNNGATVQSSMDYLNMLGYKIGTKVMVNDQITMQFEIGNDWNATEKVNDVAGNFMAKRGLLPYFSQANAKWDTKAFYVEGGILYVKGSPAMDLIGASIFNAASGVAKKYSLAAHFPWGVLTNFNLPGLRIGGPVLKGDFSLGVDLLTTIIEERTITAAVENLFVDNYSAIMFILDVPMKMGALTLNAQVVPILNRNFLDRRDSIVVDNGSDPEMAFGVDGGYKLDDNISFRAGLGYAMLSNINSRLPSETLYDRSGLNINVGSTVKAGPGKLDVDANYSFDADGQIATGQTDYYYFDLKYGWAVYKGFNVIPRARLYMSTTQTAMYVKGRPELILSWAF